MANFRILANLTFCYCYFWRFVSPSMVSLSPSFVGFTWLPSIVIAKANVTFEFFLGSIHLSRSRPSNAYRGMFVGFQVSISWSMGEFTIPLSFYHGGVSSFHQHNFIFPCIYQSKFTQAMRHSLNTAQR